MEFEKVAGNEFPNIDPACICKKGEQQYAWNINCPVHGNPKLKQRSPKKREKEANFITAAKRNRFQILSRGMPKYVLVDPDDGHLIFVWLRRGLKSYKGSPLKGLDRNQRFIYLGMRDKLSLDCRIY